MRHANSLQVHDCALTAFDMPDMKCLHVGREWGLQALGNLLICKRHYRLERGLLVLYSSLAGTVGRARSLVARETGPKTGLRLRRPYPSLLLVGLVPRLGESAVPADGDGSQF
jgi:hypothetical protein